MHLKRSRGPSPPQAARRKASAVSPFAQRLILKLNFTFQKNGRGMIAVFENMIRYYGSPIKKDFSAISGTFPCEKGAHQSYEVTPPKPPHLPPSYDPPVIITNQRENQNETDLF